MSVLLSYLKQGAALSLLIFLGWQARGTYDSYRDRWAVERGNEAYEDVLKREESLQEESDRILEELSGVGDAPVAPVIDAYFEFLRKGTK